MIRLLLDRPRVFFALVTVGLGVLGSQGWLGSRYGPQAVPSGAAGFAFGAGLGIAAGVAFFVLRRARVRRARS